MNSTGSVLKYQLKSFENLPIKIWDDPKQASKHIADSISLAIRQKQQEGEKIVLGLATGSSPIQVYSELVRMHKEVGLSFKNVITFNLDEYYPMHPDAQQSYVRFMNEYLFDHIDIPKENINIPDGTIEIVKLSGIRGIGHAGLTSKKLFFSIDRSIDLTNPDFFFRFRGYLRKL